MSGEANSDYLEEFFLHLILLCHKKWEFFKIRRTAISFIHTSNFITFYIFFLRKLNGQSTVLRKQQEFFDLSCWDPVTFLFLTNILLVSSDFFLSDMKNIIAKIENIVRNLVQKNILWKSSDFFFKS